VPLLPGPGGDSDRAGMAARPETFLVGGSGRPCTPDRPLAHLPWCTLPNRCDWRLHRGHRLDRNPPGRSSSVVELTPVFTTGRAASPAILANEPSRRIP